MFERVILAVAEETGVPWAQVLSAKREAPEIAAARRLAMAVSVAAGIPPFLVARMFNRRWATVDYSRSVVQAECLADEAARDRFIRILYLALGK